MISLLKKNPFLLWSQFSFWLSCMLTFNLFLGHLTIVLPLMNGPSSTLQKNLDKWEEKQFPVLIRETRSLIKVWHSTLPFAMICLLAYRVKQWIILTISWTDAISNTMFAYILECNREFLMHFRSSSLFKFLQWLLITRI